MPHSGLNNQRVVEGAVRLIEQVGLPGFSMRALAEALNVRTASLYNHVESMDALLMDVCAHALRMQREQELRAIEGYSGRAGILPLAMASRQFAREHRELYRLIMSTAVSCGERFSDISQCILEPFLTVLADTALTPTEQIHWQRVLRGIIHGFVSQEDAGFFSHLDADREESFRVAVQCYIDGLAQAEKRGRT